MKIANCMKTLGISFALITTAPITVSSLKAQTVNLEKSSDSFERAVTPKGVTDSLVLKKAPNPQIMVQNEDKFAKFIIDLSSNILYEYNEIGNPEKAYLIASGKPSTPTDKGVRVVSHTERYPYKTAPKNTKRYKTPILFGPRTIILNKLNPKTGAQAPTGEFIHGNNKPSSIGKYVSKGCMRMDNEVIKELATKVKRGDIVIIQ